MSILAIARKLKKMVEDDGFVEEAEIEDLDQWLWNNGELQEDSLVPTLGPGYRGPHNERITRKPMRVTVQNTEPPRSGLRW